jgi:hypothetical protein
MIPLHIKRHPVWFTAIMFFSATVFCSCKKVDTTAQIQNVKERFLHLPAGANPALQRIVEDLRIKDAIHPFIEQFVTNVGFPLWEHAKFGKPKKRSIYAKDDEEEIAEVPVVLDVEKLVNGILSIKLDADPLYKLFKSEDWESWGFNKDPNRTTPNADDVVAKFMAYEKEIWADQFFKIYDNRLFDKWPSGTTRQSSFDISLKFDDYVIDIDYICDWTTGGELTGCPPGVDHCYNLVPVFCTGSWIVWENGPVDDGDAGGWGSYPGSATGGGSGWNHGGGGSSGGNPSLPSTPGESPCTPNVPWVRLTAREGVLWNPCLNQPLQPGGGLVFSDDPCSSNSVINGENITATFKNTNLNTAIATLTSSYTTERSISYGKSHATGQLTTTPVSVSTSVDVSNTAVTDPNIDIEGSIHTHNNNGFAPPSAGDIIMLANANSNYNPGFKTSYIIAQNGAQYALLVIDETKAAEFYNANFENYSQNIGWSEGTTIGDYFWAIVRQLINEDHKTEAEARELAQAHILTEFNSGIALMKADEEGNFHEIHEVITIDSLNNFTYQTIICP